MKVYKIELLVIDFDELGEERMKLTLESVRYPNDSVSLKVKRMDTREVEWSDRHPLNLDKEQDAEYARLFS